MTIMQRRLFLTHCLIGLVSPPLSVFICLQLDDPPSLWLVTLAVGSSLAWLYGMWHNGKLTWALEVARREHERERVNVFADLKVQADAAKRIVSEADSMMAGVRSRMLDVDAKQERFDASHERVTGQLDRVNEELERMEETIKLPSLDPLKKPKPLPS